MHNGQSFLNVIKKAALEATEASNPATIEFGTVTSVSPLKIQIDQKLTLTSAQLILTRNVTDYYVDMTVDHLTEKRAGGSGENAFSSHDHEYKGRKTFLVHKSLQVGEEVVLVRMQGGQKFVVFDRLGE